MGALAVVLLAVAAYLTLQVSMLVVRGDFAWEKFRGYFPFDQMSYLSIVVDGSRGDFGFTEPFTGTGVDYYPHAYYLLLGLIAYLSGGSPVLVWQVVGVTVQTLAVAGLAVTVMILSGRRWTGLLAPLPFLVGTLSTISHDGWYTALASHAVLWGAFGVLFTLNGEAAALCLGALALLALIMVADGRGPARRRLVLALVACLVLGLLSSVQTYAFLTGVYLAGYTGAALALMYRRARVAAVVSVGLLASLPFVGPWVGEAVGPLAVLVLGLVPAVPGLILLLLWLRVRALACYLAAVLGAAPQVLWTVRGVATGDRFLLYRQASTVTLGVDLRNGLIASSVPLLVLVLLLAAGLLRRRPLWVAAPIGGLTAWTLLAGNDRWGANQEPYRLWIDGFALVIVVVLPLAVQAATEMLSRRGATSSVSQRVSAAVACVAVIGLAGATLGDYIGFWRYGRSGFAMIDFGTSQAAAVAALVGPTSSLAGDASLRLPDPCLDVFMVKVRSAAPTAFYNAGMAWPAHEPAMRRLLAADAAGTLDVDAARASNATLVLTDSACASDWASEHRGDLQRIDSVGYTTATGEPATVTAWRLRPAA